MAIGVSTARQHRRCMSGFRCRAFKAVAILSGAAVAGSGAAIAGSVVSGSSAQATVSAANYRQSASDGKFTIVLNNNYVGNEWRVEMQRLTAAMATSDAPFKGHVNFKVIDSENDPSSQIATLNDIIATHPAAIIMDASSPTALDGVVQKACNLGIVVVSVDQLVSNKCAYRVDEDATSLYAANASWLFRTLGGRGSVAEDIGLPGNPLSTDSIAAFKSELKKYPRISVVGTYAGDYAPGPNEQGVADLLAAGKTIDGVYVAGGGSYGAIQALIHAHHRWVPITNFGDMGPQTIDAAREYAKAGLQMQFAQNPPTLAGYGLEVAWAVLHHQSPVVKSWGLRQGPDPRYILLPSVVYNTNGLKSDVANVEALPASAMYKLVNSSLPSDAQVPFSIPQAPVTAAQVFG